MRNKSIVYRSILTSQKYPINLACTCKLAKLENGVLVVYTFNQILDKLPDFIKDWDNEDAVKELFETLKTCECE